MKRACKLFNRRCGHIASMGDRAVLEAQRDALAGAGHHDWRVHVAAPADRAVFAARGWCAGCQVDSALLGLAAA